MARAERGDEAVALLIETRRFPPKNVVLATITGRGRRTARRVAKWPGIQLSPREDLVSADELDHLQLMIRSEIQQALAAALPQANYRPTGLPGPASSGDSSRSSASLHASETPAVPALQTGTSLRAQTGLGGCLHASMREY